MNKSLFRLMLGVSISGTLGVFVKQVNLASGEIMAIRTLLGGSLILLMFLLKREDFNRQLYKENLTRLLLSGFLFAISGLFLFAAYDYISVSIASLVYSLNPVFIFLFSIIILGNPFNKDKFMGIILALIGLVLVNGLDGNWLNRGVIYVLIAALCYGLMATINKRIEGLPGLLTTASQILVSSGVLFIYLYINGRMNIRIESFKEIVILAILGFVHTGYAMYLYYDSIQKLEAQTVALASYMEPLSALVSSSIILGDRLGPIQILGGCLILGGALYGELRGGRYEARNKEFNN